MSIEELTDAELADLGEALRAELRRRALDRNDPVAVADQAFSEGFVSGLPIDPWIVPGGMLVCAGGLKARPSGNHRCSFVAVDGEQWCWQTNYIIDDVRHDDLSMTSITLLVAEPGLVVTQVTSKCEGGRHARQVAESWRVEKGALLPIATPSRVPDEHRR